MCFSTMGNIHIALISVQWHVANLRNSLWKQYSGERMYINEMQYSSGVSSAALFVIHSSRLLRVARLSAGI
jgi:hypothetical protein